MCNAGNRRHHTQKDSDRIARGKIEQKWEVNIKEPSFCLEKCGKLKSSHRKRGLLSSRSQTCGYHVCHAARRHKCRTESQASKKKNGRRGNDTYIQKISRHIQPKYVHPCERKTKLLIFLCPSKVWTTPRIGGQLMGPAKTPESSRVAAKDDWLLGIVISITVVGPR